jgi:hypothetical protein
MNEEQTFKAWCIVELFGHVTLAGYVSEQAIGGASFIRLDVPAVDGQAEFTKLLGPGAVYSITPTSEDVARSAIERIRAKPVNVYYLPEPKGTIVERDDEVENEVDDGSFRVDTTLIVDHIATLNWIKREAPAGWCSEFHRRLEEAKSLVDMFDAHCPDCDGKSAHATGTRSDVCMECGYVHPDTAPF